VYVCLGVVCLFTCIQVSGGYVRLCVCPCMCLLRRGYVFAVVCLSVRACLVGYVVVGHSDIQREPDAASTIIYFYLLIVDVASFSTTMWPATENCWSPLRAPMSRSRFYDPLALV